MHYRGAGGGGHVPVGKRGRDGGINITKFKHLDWQEALAMERDKIYYNYFKDVNPNYKEKNFIMKSRTDPDQCSAQLYDALYKLFCYDGEVLKSYKINCVQVVG